METENIYYSPIICYELSYENSTYGIEVYLQGHKNSDNPQTHLILKDFSKDEAFVRSFLKFVSSGCAMPVHIPEIAEEYLSVNSLDKLNF